MKMLKKKLGALVSVLSVLIIGSFFATSPAFSDTTLTPNDTSTLGNANIDTSKTGSITLHKYSGENWSEEYPSGKEITPKAGAQTLDKVPFTIKKLALDLSKPEDVAKIADLKCETGTAKSGTSTVNFDNNFAANQQTTANGGVAKFENLSVGVYLISEDEAPAELNIVRKAAPFCVMVPTNVSVTAGEAAWLYDVHVYPKNSTTGTKKSVDDSTTPLKENDIVNWTVTGDVPNGSEDVTEFKFTDQLDERLAFDNAANPVVVKSGNTIFEAGDYTVTSEARTDCKVASDPSKTKCTQVVVEFTQAGLAKLTRSHKGAEVEVTIPTKVGNIGDGKIYNDALLNANGKEVKTNKVNTVWGQLRIFKYGDNKNQKLSGAEFEIYDVDPATPGATALTTLTTDENGEAFIDSLRVGVRNNATAVDPTTSQKYWIKEIKAPAGYQIPANAVTEVTVNAGEMAAASYNAEVQNTRPKFNIPLTGGQGQMLILLGGATLLLLAGGGYMVSARLRRTQA